MKSLTLFIFLFLTLTVFGQGSIEVVYCGDSVLSSNNTSLILGIINKSIDSLKISSDYTSIGFDENEFNDIGYTLQIKTVDSFAYYPTTVNPGIDWIETFRRYDHPQLQRFPINDTLLVTINLADLYTLIQKGDYRIKLTLRSFVGKQRKNFISQWLNFKMKEDYDQFKYRGSLNKTN